MPLTVPGQPDQAPAPAPVVAPDPIPAQILDSQRLQLRETLRQVQADNPDKASAVVRLAAAARLHPSTVADAQDDVRAAVAVQAADVDGLMRDHPQLAGWLMDWGNASVAHDDIPALRRLSSAVRQITAGPQDDPLGVLPQGFQFQRGIIQERTSPQFASPVGDYQELERVLQERGTQAFLDELAAKDRTTRVGSLANPIAAGAMQAWSGAILAARTLAGGDAASVQQSAQAIAQTSSERYPGFGWDAVRMGSGLVADLPLLFAGGPLAEGAQALGAIRGTVRALTPLLGEAGAAAMGNRVAVVAAMSPMAGKAGLVSGSEQGAGYGAVDAFLNLAIPGAFGRVGVARALTPTLAEIGGAQQALPAARFLLSQAGLDAAQNSALELATAIHAAASGADPTALQPHNLIPRLGLSGLFGGLAGAAFNLPEAARLSLARQGIAVEQARVEGQALAAAYDAALASKTIARAPDQAADLVRQVTAETGGSGATVYMQSGAFREHFQAKGEDPAAAAEAMGIDPTAYAAAMSGDAPLAVPLDRFLTRARPEDKPLLNHASLRPDGLTPAAIQPATESARQALLAQVQAAAAGEPGDSMAASAERVAQTVEAQLVAAGTDPLAARQQAKLWGAATERLASRWNAGSSAEAQTTPEGLFQHYKVQIGRAEDGTPEGVVLSQAGAPDRGRIRIGPGPSLDIGLLRHADLSTFLHESGHGYLAILDDLASRPQAPADIVSDTQTIRQWLGADAGKPFTTDQHEQFARGFEAYLMEGKAPSARLRTAFATFARWLVGIYHSLRNLRVDLTPEVRGVFDRLLATDTELAHAAEALHAEPMFATAAEAGMSAADFAAYRQAASLAKARAADSLRAEILHGQAVADRAERNRVRAQLAETIAAQVDTRQDLTAIRALQDGVVPPDIVIPAGVKLKLDRADIVRQYGEKALQQLPGPRRGDVDKANAGRAIYTTEDGMSLADAALLFGYRDAPELWEALTTAPDREALIRAGVDAEMAKRFPDPLLSDNLAAEASARLADELAGELVIREVNALEAKAGGDPTPRQLMRAAAERTIAGVVAYRLRPDTYRVAAESAARRQFQAAARLRDGDPAQRAHLEAEILHAAQQRLLNLELYHAAQRAQDQGRADAEWIRSHDTLEARARLGKAGGWEYTVRDPTGAVVSIYPDEAQAAAAVAQMPGGSVERTSGYLEQWGAILEGYDLRRASNRSLQRREALRAWISRQEDAGEPVAIADQVVEDLGRRHWNELTVADQRAVIDALHNVHHLATMKNRLMASHAKATLDATAAELATSITANARGTVAPRLGTTGLEAAGEMVGDFFASHRKDSFLAREMDGYTAAGPVWERFIRPRNEAADRQDEMLAAAARQRDADLRAWEGSPGLVRESVPGTRLRLTREQRIGLALHWGNAEGRQRVLADLDRLGLGTADVEAILHALDPADVALIRATWQQLGGYKPQVASLERRTVGVEPAWVDPLPFRTAHGVLEGGYYPLKYDRTQGDKAADLEAAADAKGRLRAANAAAATRRGFTKARAQQVKGRGLRYDFGVVSEHLGEVIHDLTHREVIMDQNRLLRHDRIAGAIVQHYGKRALDQLTSTAADIATGDQPAKSKIERYARQARKGVSAAVFTWQLTSAIVNVTGLLQSLTRVGPGRMLWAVAHVTGDAARFGNAMASAEAKSAFMRQRSRTFLREVAEANRNVGAQGTLDTIQRWGYYPMSLVTRTVDTITWHAAYDQGLELAEAKGLRDRAAEELAVAHADQVVIDTQGSGRVGDLAAIQRGGEFAKAATAFYSYFATTYNLEREALARIRLDDPRSWLRAGTTTLLVWTLPAYLSEVIAGALRGDQQEKTWKDLAGSQAAYGLGMLVGIRELSSAVQGYNYRGPASLWVLGEGSQFVQQIRQGDADSALLKAATGTAFALFGLPAVEVGRLVDAWNLAAEEGDFTAAARAALFGKARGGVP